MNEPQNTKQTSQEIDDDLEHGSGTVVFFSAEYAIEEDLPIFAGGLGVLAGDYLLEAGKAGVEMIGVGMFYHGGFISKEEEIGMKHRVTPADVGYTLAADEEGHVLRVKVPIRGEDTLVQLWRKNYGTAQLWLLDCDIEDNSEAQRKYSANLYDPDPMTKACQEAVFGLGAVEFFEQLGVEPSVYHLNEGHMGLVAIALIAKYKAKHPKADLHEAAEYVRSKTVATKHTILSAAGARLSYEVFDQMVGAYVYASGLEVGKVFDLGRGEDGQFGTTDFIIRISHRSNGVSKLHTICENQADSNLHLVPITNGINLERWQLPEIRRAKAVEKELWEAHARERTAMIDYVNQETGSKLSTDPLTVVWARRITSYKRPTEILTDYDRLAAILMHAKKPVQIIMAGKANISDTVGQEMVREILAATQDRRFGGRIAYLPNYHLESARYLVRGADLWLNTPKRGWEASGTSGMKAGSNGVLQCSVSDGWIDEVDLNDFGWVLTPDNTAANLYQLLETDIRDLFYEQEEDGTPLGWVKAMQATIALIEEQFSSRRMLRDYLRQLY